MLHGDFQLQKVLPKINVARKLNVKKSCNEEVRSLGGGASSRLDTQGGPSDQQARQRRRRRALLTQCR